MYEESSLAKNSAQWATSSGSPTRPRGMWSRIRYIGCCGLLKMGSLVAGERNMPGLMQLTRMPWRAPSAASCFVSAMTPPLEAV
jgi:hypothetical protein